jgi:MFS family permease
MLLPLALAQFVASFAGSNMNVAISSIADDLGTSVSGVQAAITLFLLTMAALMIVGSKLSDVIGRKRCFVLGLFIYGAGAVVGAVSQGLPLLIVGYSVMEGVGSALMIPPIYILTTVLVTDQKRRARAFGLISGLGGVGAAAGPLVGGLITTAVSWRVSFLFQALIVAVVLVLSRRIVDPGIQGERPAFDALGGVLSALGMVLLVIGVLLLGKNNVLAVVFMVVGLLVLVWLYYHLRSRERRGKVPLLATRVLKNRTANLGLVTQNVQWLMLMGTSITVSIFLQVVHGYSAIETGVVFTAATAGLLLSSLLAGRMAQRRSQRNVVIAGFLITIAGLVMLLVLGAVTSNVVATVPGLFFIGLGVGAMLTFSVNIVQSAFPEKDQGEISGLSRSVSNFGSSLGTAITGIILVSNIPEGNRVYAWALVALIIFGLGGLFAAIRIPPDKKPRTAEAGSAEGPRL